MNNLIAQLYLNYPNLNYQILNYQILNYQILNYQILNYQSYNKREKEIIVLMPKTKSDYDMLNKFERNNTNNTKLFYGNNTVVFSSLWKFVNKKSIPQEPVVLFIDGTKFRIGHLNFLKSHNIKLICSHFTQNYITYSYDFPLYSEVEQTILNPQWIIPLLDFNNSYDIGFTQSSIRKLQDTPDSAKNILEIIRNDVKYLEERHIMTARLGVALYRICHFNLFFSAKLIGQEYRKLFGKSKPKTNKKYKIENRRCYDVTNFKINYKEIIKKC